ncbi:MAG: hypothetical protein HZA89_17670 [Verrucomicrobia bacterium]|nr:hypothetical protein [Verrucomicrobiota bacterium]
MTDTEQNILQALLDLDSAVQQMKTANPKPDLLPIFTRLDEFARQLPPDADADLRHYMVRKSYEKARLHLQGRGAENARGSCGR